jgi:hypothetical protein
MSRLIKNVHLVVFFFLITACVSTPTPSSLSSASVSKAVRLINSSSLRSPDTTSITDVDQRAIRVKQRLMFPIRRICNRDGGLSEKKCGKGFEFSINIDDDFNAYAHGSNNITINSGLIRRTVTDEELAFVLAHEAAHHIANHLAENKINSAIGGMVGSVLMGALTVGVMSALGVECDPDYEDCSWLEDIAEDSVEDGKKLGNEFAVARYSREQELEADRIASAILKDTKMDLAKVVPLMAYMGKLDAAGRFSEFGDSHPSGTERLAAFLQDNPLINQGYLSKSTSASNPKVQRVDQVRAGSDSLRITASGYSWVDVNDSTGAKVFSQVVSLGLNDIAVTSLPLMIKVSSPRVTQLSYGGKALDYLPFFKPMGQTKFALCPDEGLVEEVSQCAQIRPESAPDLAKKSSALVRTAQVANQASTPDSLSISTEGYSWVEIRDANGKRVFFKSGYKFTIVREDSPPLKITVGRADLSVLSYKGRALNAQSFTDSSGLANFALCADGNLAEEITQCAELSVDNVPESVDKHVDLVVSPPRLDKGKPGPMNLRVVSKQSWVEVSDSGGKLLFGNLVVEDTSLELIVDEFVTVLIGSPLGTDVKIQGNEVDLLPFQDRTGNATFVLCPDGGVFSDEKDCPQP